MPITIREFNEGNFTLLRGNPLKVIEHFRENKDKAYSSKELADIIGCSQPSINPTLKKLIKEGFLESKPPYFAFSTKGKAIKIVKDEMENEDKPEPKLKSIKKEEVEPYEGEDAEPEPFEEPQQ